MHMYKGLYKTNQTCTDDERLVSAHEYVRKNCPKNFRM